MPSTSGTVPKEFTRAVACQARVERRQRRQEDAPDEQCSPPNEPLRA